MAATSSAGTRDAPVPAIRSADRSAVANSGRASTSAHWVGTPWPTVIRSASRTATASAARHGVGVITVVTPLAASSHIRVIEPTWANGSGDSRRSPGSDSTSVPSATARRLSWSNTAPFGSPVVPLVHTTATGSVGSSTGPCSRRRPVAGGKAVGPGEHGAGRPVGRLHPVVDDRSPPVGSARRSRPPRAPPGGG